MATVLWLAGLALLFAFCLIGLVSLVFGLPGTFIIFASALVYAWATGFTSIEWTVPAWLFAMAILGEILEFLAASVAASSASAEPSRRVTIAAIVGAVIGGIVGTPFLFGIGSLLGALAGAFAGAALAVGSRGGTLRESMKIGLAAMRGRLFGFVLKSAIAATMIVIIAAALLR